MLALQVLRLRSLRISQRVPSNSESFTVVLGFADLRHAVVEFGQIEAALTMGSSPNTHNKRNRRNVRRANPARSCSSSIGNDVARMAHTKRLLTPPSASLVRFCWLGTTIVIKLRRPWREPVTTEVVMVVARCFESIVLRKRSSTHKSLLVLLFKPDFCFPIILPSRLAWQSAAHCRVLCIVEQQ